MKNITPVFPYECLLESEFVSELNIYFVFNVLTENINDYLDIYEQMRLEHPFLNKEEKIQLMLTNNKADILKEMIHVPDFDQSINTICQFKKLRDSMSEQIRSTTDCIICFEETDDTYINSCGHVMSVCTECLDPYKNTKKCAVCKTSLSLQKCFVV